MSWPSRAQLDALFIELDELLAGIDADQSCSPEAWWENADGARFGAGKKAEIQNLLKRYLDCPERRSCAGA